MKWLLKLVFHAKSSKGRFTLGAFLINKTVDSGDKNILEPRFLATSAHKWIRTIVRSMIKCIKRLLWHKNLFSF